MTIQMFATGVVAYLSEKLGISFYLLSVLLVLMVIDYFTGMTASAVEALDHPGDTGYGCIRRMSQRNVTGRHKPHDTYDSQPQ